MAVSQEPAHTGEQDPAAHKRKRKDKDKKRGFDDSKSVPVDGATETESSAVPVKKKGKEKANDDDEASSNAQAKQEKDKKQKKRKAESVAPVKAPPPDEDEKDSDRGNSSSSSDEGDDVARRKSGRKRKRKRKKKDAPPSAEAESGPAKTEQARAQVPKPEVADTPAITPPTANLSLPSTVPNPYEDARISSNAAGEGEDGEEDAENGPSAAQNALAYSIAFSMKDSPSSLPNDGTPDWQKGWKFNKARQNWILRHLLEMPSSVGSTIVPEGKGNGGEDVAAEGDQQAVKTAIPDEYMPYIGNYLKGLKGAARAKLLKDLEEARDAPAEAKIATPATAQAGVTAAPDANSHVRFGDLALQMEAEGAPVVPGTDAAEAKRARAKVILTWMQEAA